MPQDTPTDPTLDGTYRKGIQLNALLQAMAFIEQFNGPEDTQSELVFLAAEMADEMDTRLGTLISKSHDSVTST